MRGRREGQVIPQGEGRWRLRYYLGTNPKGGKRRYQSRTFTGSKRGAEKELRRILGERDAGLYVPPSRETIAQFMERWLESAARQKVRPRTFADYRYFVQQYIVPRLGPMRLQGLRPSDVQAMIGDLVAKGLAPGTVRLIHRVLNSALTQAVRWQDVARNPASGVELPKGRAKEARALSRAEVKRLRDALKEDRLAVLFDVALLTGMRPSEILGLPWKAVDFQAETVSVCQVLSRRRGSKAAGEKAKWEFADPKTKRSRRTIPIPPELVSALRAHKAAQGEEAMKLGRLYARHLDLVFATREGQPLSDRNLSARSFKPAVSAAGLPETLRMYDLRHTHCTLLLADGLNVSVVSERLGHASAGFTLSCYAHVLEGQQHEATERIGALIYD